MRLLRRLWHFLAHRQPDADLAEELDLHRELIQQDLERRGVPPAEALIAARRRLGRTSQASEEARDVWAIGWLRDLSQDVRFGVRVLAKDRRLTLAVVV